MKRFIVFFTVVISVFYLQTACNQSNKAVTPEEVGLYADTLDVAGQKMQQYIDNGKLAGISALIYKNGRNSLSQEFWRCWI